MRGGQNGSVLLLLVILKDTVLINQETGEGNELSGTLMSVCEPLQVTEEVASHHRRHLVSLSLGGGWFMRTMRFMRT